MHLYHDYYYTLRIKLFTDRLIVHIFSRKDNEDYSYDSLTTDKFYQRTDKPITDLPSVVTILPIVSCLPQIPLRLVFVFAFVASVQFIKRELKVEKNHPIFIERFANGVGFTID